MRGRGCDGQWRSLSCGGLRCGGLRVGHLHRRSGNEKSAQKKGVPAMTRIHASCAGCSGLWINSHFRLPTCLSVTGNRVRRTVTARRMWPYNVTLDFRATPAATQTWSQKGGFFYFGIIKNCCPFSMLCLILQNRQAFRFLFRALDCGVRGRRGFDISSFHGTSSRERSHVGDSDGCTASRRRNSRPTRQGFALNTAKAICQQEQQSAHENLPLRISRSAAS